MFATIFAFVFLTAYAAPEIPSYIHVCGRRDPKFDQCILNNINIVKSKICNGIPEFDVLSFDPFIIEKITLSDTPDIKLYVRDAKVTGFCNSKATNLTADVNNLHFDVDFIMDQIRGNTTYDFNLQLLVPVRRKGALYLTSDAHTEAHTSFDLALITKGGKRYAYMSKVKLNIDIKNYNAQYDMNENSDQLNTIIRHFVETNKEQIIKNLKPALEEVVSKQMILISNSLLKHFTYEELFPDRT